MNHGALASVSNRMPAHTASHRPLRSLAAIAAGALLVVGLAACGDDDDDDVSAGSDTTVTTAEDSDSDAGVGEDDDGTDTTQADDGADAAATSVQAADFSLTSATVAPGAEVAFENTGAAPHTMTADDDSFDSGRIEGGASGSVTAPSDPGDYPFHCEIHPQMTGTLTVEG